MQDYAPLFHRKFRKRSRLNQIRKLLLSGLSPELLVVLIAAIVFRHEVITLFRR